jgi:hypothetical protein
MPEHKIGTREEWQAARDELAKLEAEQAKQDEEVIEIVEGELPSHERVHAAMRGMELVFRPGSRVERIAVSRRFRVSFES